MGARNVLKPYHVEACRLKVEEDFSDTQIAKQIGFTRQAVNQWWEMEQVKRELVRAHERYAIEKFPRLVVEYTDIRDKAIAKIKDFFNPNSELKNDLRPRDYLEVFKVMNETLDAELAKIRPDEQKTSQAAEVLNQIQDVLSDDELVSLARRIRDGNTKEPRPPQAIEPGIEERHPSSSLT